MTEERKRKIVSAAIGLSIFAGVVALAFAAYADPAMLLDFANIRICS